MNYYRDRFSRLWKVENDKIYLYSEFNEIFGLGKWSNFGPVDSINTSGLMFKKISEAEAFLYIMQGGPE